MNTKIKKFLCEYFSEDGENKRATIGSILYTIFVFLILLGIIIFVLYLFYESIGVYEAIYNGCQNCPDDIFSLLGLIGIALESVIVLIAIGEFITYISKIEITRCNKEE